MAITNEMVERPEQEANAELIASIPDMIAEIERLKKLTVLAPLSEREKTLVNQCESRADENRHLRSLNAELCTIVIQLLKVVEFKRRTTPPYTPEPSNLEIRAGDLLAKATAGEASGGRK